MYNDFKKSNAEEKAMIKASATAVLENFLKYYLIFIDTCSLLGRQFDRFFENIRGFLERRKSECEAAGQEFKSPIIVPKRVVEELMEFAYTDKKPELTVIAMNRIRFLKRVSEKGLVRIIGEDTDNFADNVFLCVFTKERIHRNLLLITEDRKLASEILQLNNSKAVKGRTIQVRRINQGGYLSQFMNSGENSYSRRNNRSNGAANLAYKPAQMKWSFHIEADIPLDITSVPKQGQYVCTQRDNSIAQIIQLGNKIASGGEGTLYDAGNGYVAKVYHPHCLTKRRKEKIEMMASMKLRVPGICFPVEPLYNYCLEFIGYLMPKAEGKELAKCVFIQPVMQMTFPDWKKEDLVKLTLTILEKIQCIHQNGMLIGDLNPNNILVKSPTEVWFVDTDSYQIGPYPCPVGTVLFTAPEIQGKNFSEFLRTEGNENFAIATMVFMLMMLGKTPYARLNGGSQQEDICSMKFPYPLEGRSNKLAPMGNWRYMWSHLPYNLKAALYFTFMKGEKYAEEGTRLGVEEWITLISKYHYLLTSGTLRANDPMSELLFPTRTKLSDKAEQVRCSACGEIINRQDLRAGLCPECQERERACTCRKCGKAFTVTGLERNEQHRSYNFCEDCGSEVARRFFCISCRREYEITVGEMDYYDENGYDIPIRCPNCRKEKKRILREKHASGKSGKKFTQTA